MTLRDSKGRDIFALAQSLEDKSVYEYLNEHRKALQDIGPYGKHECSICLDEKPLQECVTLPCEHRFCRQCEARVQRKCHGGKECAMCRRPYSANEVSQSLAYL